MLSDLETGGGAAIAASRLASSLVDAGCEVLRVVRHTQGRGHAWKTKKLRSWWFRLLPRRILHRRLPGNWQPIARSMTGGMLESVIRDFQPDVISIHNLHRGAGKDGWSSDMVARSAQHAPVVWSLHDMWSFTGRCAYSMDCRMFETGCDDGCPTPDEYPALAPHLIQGAWNEKKYVADSDANIVIVTPSAWLANEAKAGIWKGKRVEVIPNGVSLQAYQPIDRGAARAEFAIKGDTPVLALSACDLQSRWKGMSFLLEALERMDHDVSVLALGHGNVDVANKKINIHLLGYIDDPKQQSMVYGAADVFVHPAVADVHPLVLIEAMACGTPCVGFPIGGVQEIIQPNVSGWLADDVSIEALGRALDTALREAASLRESARRHVQAHYDIHLHTERYLNLFRELTT